MTDTTVSGQPGARVALGMSTLHFTACFAVWTIFSIIGLRIKTDLGLTDAEFGLLAGTPILTGSLARLPLGVWADQFGGRRVNLAATLVAAGSAFLLSYGHSYLQFLLAALGLGLAGATFSVGVGYVSKFYPPKQQGTALGVFGAGNLGAALTNLAAPLVLLAMGWQAVAQIWAATLAIVAVLVFFVTRDEPELARRRALKQKPRSMLEQLAPLRRLQVWRFALYYFFVFGASVALALWLPRYLIGVYKLDIRTAGMMAAAFSTPAALFRIFGGWLSDRIGARTVMYLTFGVSLAAAFVLSYPATTYVVDGIDGPIQFRVATALPVFTVLIFTLGFFMALGMAAVFKHIPVYYPEHIGAVGGVVGMIGGLGGFVLPIAFGALNDLTHVWTSCFMLLFILVGTALAWMHVAVLRMEREHAPTLAELPQLPEMAQLHFEDPHRPAGVKAAAE
ncbi:nitrate/nitrite transporter [Phenylobacterium sp.]|uniref:MFS transporter n=1 Tax=Phenylobacterium sp. TaxID=1871053 RepID=UPI0025CCEF14|nr:nitrate/nitrite transporter [Phenylobacterium sp.]